jgi:hypothetical protein
MAQGDMHITDVQARETYFAPARRSSTEMLTEQVGAVVAHPVVEAVLDSFCGQVLVLNRERQILAASPEFREALAACGIHDFVGKRPGEALGCEHSDEGPGGCGTSLACAHCGAAMAILAAQCCGSPDYEECWIGIRRGQQRHSVEFRAKATPIHLPGYEVVVLALQDISDQKRRVVLEQTFLHDARNLLGSILMWSEVLAQEPCEEAIGAIRKLALQLRDQLNGHRMLVRAEKGDLVVASVPLDLPDLARALRDTFSGHASGEGKSLVVQFPVDMPAPLSDPNLVLRILTNMVTNALEATCTGATVTARFELRGGMPTFKVHNPGAIPPEIASRIFQRSFSTKSEPGHGLGTYSMRLFAEQYLGGQVSFTSSVEEGTMFVLTLPAGQG